MLLRVSLHQEMICINQLAIIVGSNILKMALIIRNTKRNCACISVNGFVENTIEGESKKDVEFFVFKIIVNFF